MKNVITIALCFVLTACGVSEKDKKAVETIIHNTLIVEYAKAGINVDATNFTVNVNKLIAVDKEKEITEYKDWCYCAFSVNFKDGADNVFIKGDANFSEDAIKYSNVYNSDQLYIRVYDVTVSDDHLYGKKLLNSKYTINYFMGKTWNDLEREVTARVDIATYEILLVKGTDPTNYHVVIKNSKPTEEAVFEFAKAFKEEKSKTAACNIHVYDSKAIVPLLEKYPLKGDEYVLLADHYVGLYDFSGMEWWYPLQDSQYKDYGGKNWKKD